MYVSMHVCHVWHVCIMYVVYLCMHACMHAGMHAYVFVCIISSTQEPQPPLQELCVARPMLLHLVEAADPADAEPTLPALAEQAP